jgi:hypothetical protein
LGQRPRPLAKKAQSDQPPANGNGAGSNIKAELDALTKKLKEIPLGNGTLNARRRLKKKITGLQSKIEAGVEK